MVLQNGERFTLASFAYNGKGYDCWVEYREKTTGGSKVLGRAFVMFHSTMEGAKAWSERTNRREADGILRRKGMVEVNGVPTAVAS